MNFMAKKELFKNPLLRFIIKTAGAFPVDREQVDLGAIKTSLRYLKSRGRVMIFPEGKRVAPEEAVQAKLGAVRIALKSGAQILPVWISRGRKLFALSRVVVGRPFTQSPPVNRDYDPLINELMERIYELEPK
jgi:1-acyl-sn-glycerol-3-phosphate acyltransferase